MTPNQYAFDGSWNMRGSFQSLLGAEAGECKPVMIPSLLFTPNKCFNELSYSLLIYFRLCQGQYEIELMEFSKGLTGSSSVHVCLLPGIDFRFVWPPQTATISIPIWLCIKLQWSGFQCSTVFHIKYQNGLPVCVCVHVRVYLCRKDGGS